MTSFISVVGLVLIQPCYKCEVEHFILSFENPKEIGSKSSSVATDHHPNSDSRPSQEPLGRGASGSCNGRAFSTDRDLLPGVITGSKLNRATVLRGCGTRPSVPPGPFLQLPWGSCPEHPQVEASGLLLLHSALDSPTHRADWPPMSRGPRGEPLSGISSWLTPKMNRPHASV